MLTAFLFDERVGEPVTEWETVSKGLQENQVLWVDVVAPSTCLLYTSDAADE